MVLCWVVGCCHYNEKDCCKFYRFPINLKEKKWIELIRRTDEPKTGARVCSCHFVEGKKENGPTILPHRPHQFGTYHLTPEKKRFLQIEIKISWHKSKLFIYFLIFFLNVFYSLKLNDNNNASNGSIVSEVQNYFLQKENEAMKIELRHLGIKFNYANLNQNYELLNSYTGLPSNSVFQALYNLVKSLNIEYHLMCYRVPGDLILADKGFLIRDILPPGVSLNIPPFLDTPQFTPNQVVQTETIAKARIHIERAIQRIKCDSILDVIPFSMLKQAESIFQVVAALTNLQPPLIKEIQTRM
ncbi:unnamed protein product [Macrosiphum euphorbiae]|uniref:THAP-type domain-containing protein n=1 Tax=Macrosiphum euphorbiae TaxID=13131 RepID=A0AAV0WLG3_9HEMI|nr:unnamed protein product [Macrosiphum euphorbiae]